MEARFIMEPNFKKELLKSLSIVIISVFCSTVISFFVFPKPQAAPALSFNKKQVQSKVEKVFFTEDEVVADIVEQIAPCVVHITTKVEQTIAHDPRQFFFEDEFFKRFFGHTPREFGFNQKPLKQESSGTGSGFIITADGYILTNYHVVQNAKEITVKTTEKEEYPAKLVGKDKYSDLAIIKIKGNNFPTAKLSDSTKLRPGQWAIAVGSPHGLDHTVTLGIISALSRDIPQLSNVSFIQTDAAINPGNSGGPLLNIKGEVVGINTAIMGTAQNIGFAIPVNTAKKVVEQLKSGEEIGHPWLGIAMSPMTEELTKALGLPVKTEGVVISKLMPDGPAYTQGLRAGDIIQRIDGKKVSTAEEIQKLIKSKKVGDTINIQILRNGEMMGKKIKLGNWGEPEEKK